MNLERRRALLLLCVAALAAVPQSRPASGSKSGPLRILASPVPHAEMLRFVRDRLASGLSLEISEIYGSLRPNELLAAGDTDANFFQHLPFLRSQERDLGIQFAVAAEVHIEPLGLYSHRVQRLADLRKGDTVALPGDVTNCSRALYLLQARGILRLRERATVDERQLASPHDVVDNPLRLKFIQVDGPNLVRTIGDVTHAAIHGNYALQAGLNPSRDALALESAVGNPYVNVLVTMPTRANDSRILRLAELLRSEEVAQFIREKYQGAVIPVHG